MMKKKQVVRRMGGGPMKKQVVKKRGGGTMTPVAMRRGGGLPLVGSPMQKNTRRMNDLEELARKRKPSGRLNVDDITRATNTSTQRRSELSGMSKDQMLERAYNLAKKIKPTGRLSLDDLKRAMKNLKK